MKTVFIGDSHLPSLKSSASMSINMEKIFFICPSIVEINMGMLAIKGQALEPTHDILKLHLEKHYGQSKIGLSGVDAVVLVGLRTEFPYKLLETSGCSRQVMRLAMLDMIKEQSISFHLAQKIRAISDQLTIVVIPNPLITSHLKNITIGTAPGITPVTTFGKLTEYPDNLYLEWQLMFQKAFNPLGVHLCMQNDNTITEGIFTKPEFALDANLNGPGIRHMKASYWQAVWTDLNKILSEFGSTTNNVTH